jgi:folylpolyglutamate synthase/dihydrofolate synthase
MMDPRIPTRVVVCDSAQQSLIGVDIKQNGHYTYPGPPQYPPHPHAWPPAPQYMPRPNPGHVNGHAHHQPQPHVSSSGSRPPPVHGHGQPQPPPRSSSSGSSHPAMSVAHLTNPVANGPSKKPSQPSGGRADKIDLTLGHMRRLMDHLPPLRIPAIHLAGTNGKGSVSAMIDSILRVAGIRTARYNSPHLIEPRDAIRFAGVPPPREIYDAAVATVQRIAQEREIEVSPFELATATAYYLFATAQPPVDVMIIECGMGGVNDATNVIPPAWNLASGLTSVGLDHTTFLGDSISAITDQKARITVPGGLLVTTPHLHPDAMTTAHGIAYQLRAAVIESGTSVVLDEPRRPVSLSPFVPPQPAHVRTRLPVIIDGRMVPGEDYIATWLSLGGQHQLDNLSLALTLVHVISQDRRALSIQPALGRITSHVMQRGIELTRWEGRCSWIQYKLPGQDRSVPILVDGAHNADSAKTLAAYIRDLGLPEDAKVHYIISLSASPGKSPESVLRPLIRPGHEVTLMDFTTPVEGMPWVKPANKEEVRDVVSTLTSEEVNIVEQSGVEGLKSILGSVGETELVVVCGSLYLVADVYRLASSAST